MCKRLFSGVCDSLQREMLVVCITGLAAEIPPDNTTVQVLVNGPGTCIPICVAAFWLR